jgi:hypothetical protein
MAGKEQWLRLVNYIKASNFRSAQIKTGRQSHFDVQGSPLAV